MIAKRMMASACALTLLAGCAVMVGKYRGPEPFGGKDYVVAPPNVNLSHTERVVVLVFKDERGQIEHELDWVRQANPANTTLGQPKEVRGEFERAIKAGLSAHRRIELVASETFLQTHEADLVISGRIIQCDVERKMGWTDNKFIAQAVIEIVLRDGRGNLLTAKPLKFAVTATKVVPLPVEATLDDIRPGVVAAAMEEAIRQAAEALLTSRELSEALARR